MAAKVKPAMAYPDFASATVTFAPSKWPTQEDGGFLSHRFGAEAVTAGGEMIRQESPLKEMVISLSYTFLSASEKDALAAPDGGGFFHTVGADTFEYRDENSNVYKVKFLSDSVAFEPAGHDRWNTSLIRMLITQ